MAKKKKAAKKKVTKPDLTSQKTITILAPDGIAELDEKVLHGIGRLTVNAATGYNVSAVAVVKTSKIAPEHLNQFVPEWAKYTASGC